MGLSSPVRIGSVRQLILRRLRYFSVQKLIILMFRSYLAGFFLTFLVFSSFAQVLQPSRWHVAPSVQSAKVGDVIEIVFYADIDEKWYLYANDFDPECGPIPASFSFEPHASYSLAGTTLAVGALDKHDEIFDCDVRIFKKKAEFRQKIKVLATPLIVKGEYDYQVCTEVDGKCISGAGDFDIRDVEVTGKAASTETPPDNVSQAQHDVPPPIATVDTANVTVPVTAGEMMDADAKNVGPILDPSLVTIEETRESYWGFFLLAFLAGLTALLTPCVFPMIPMTVSYFTAPGRTRAQALVYGASIVVIFTAVGASISPLMGPETANHLSTEWIPNLIFFIVFIVFGLSFLGLFEIVMPGNLITRVDRKADQGGLLGIFFMAFTLVLVSFSCTGPIVGSILVTSAGGASVKPVIGMLGFSLAFGIPFTIFAFFPGLVSSLPKSGGWLNSVKVVLGFLEIALAFKFLSIADQAFHWGILDREINIALWIVIAALIGVYLLKGFRLPGDTGKDAEDKRIGVPRLMLAIITFTFVVYLVPGMWGAPLKALAGYLPPMHTHDFDLAGLSNNKSNQICDEPKYSEFLHLPHGLNGYFDYDQAIACARQQNKPLFIDFTGHGCTNCREMEARVWSDPQVLDRLRKDFVVVALYVDDKTELPENQWYTSSFDGKVKRTIGKQNADRQITKLNNNAQPYYILVGKDERVLVPPKAYDRSVDNFVDFLDAGKKKYKELFPQ